MSVELYFLRSSENKIVTDMFKYAHPNNPENLQKYTEFYGLTTKDLGLYALTDNQIAGAIWSRKMDDIPELSLAVLPEYKETQIATTMMEQFLLEAGELYEKISVIINEDTVKFYEKLGFEKFENSGFMIKKLEKKEVIRPTDGYDPTRWMD